MYMRRIDAKEFSASLFEKVLYSSDIEADGDAVTISLDREEKR